MSPGRLGLAILLGPVTWLVCLEADYALVPWACSRAEAGLAALFAVAAVALTAPLVGLLLGWRAWRTAGDGPTDGPPPEGRGRFMALSCYWMPGRLHAGWAAAPAFARPGREGARSSAAARCAPLGALEVHRW